MKVVDASVVLSWLLQQPEPRGAAEVLDRHVSGAEPLVAPELLHYEVGNALVSGARLPADLARQAWANFEALEVETYSLGPSEYAAAIALAADYRVTVYDASYAVLARTLQCKLITADRKLARALASLDVVETLRA